MASQSKTIMQRVLRESGVTFAPQEFLLENAPTRRGLLASNIKMPVLADGLTREEVALLQSVLPANAEGLYCAPLDKGLSGCKVFVLQVALPRGVRSKRYVVKIGPVDELDDESQRFRDFVTPHVAGLGQSILRRGLTRGAFFQEYRGIGTRSEVMSLRDLFLESNSVTRAVRNLFQDNIVGLGKVRDAKHTVSYAEEYKRYLKKAKGFLILREHSRLLKEITRNALQRPWKDPIPVIQRVTQTLTPGRVKPVHGDLHAQNVLVDKQHLNTWLIDFGWTHEGDPLKDAAVLEASFKFLCVPFQSDPCDMLKIEERTAADFFFSPHVPRTVYSDEILRMQRVILEIRDYANTLLDDDATPYYQALLMVTAGLTTNMQLNHPLVLGSCEVLARALSSK